MRFIQGDGREIGLIDAALTRFPSWDGAYALSGEADLRPAVYAPESGYADTASLAISALFGADADPLLCSRLADRAFPAEPPSFRRGEDILVLDLAEGPSGSASDPGAAFLAAIAAEEARRGRPVTLLADGSGWEGAALSEAAAGIPRLDLILLYPEGSSASGIRPARLAREGGSTTLVGTRTDSDGVEAMIRALAGTVSGGHSIVAAGGDNPARFASRIIGLTAAFAPLRRGTSGELFIGLRGGDPLDLAAGLWAWRLGLPITGFFAPRLPSPGLTAPRLAAKGELLGAAMLDRFEKEMPGAARSLLVLVDVGESELESATKMAVGSDGSGLDRESAAILAAAEKTLAGGLRGHARIVVPRLAHPCWEGRAPAPSGLSSGLLDARKDACLGSRPAELAEFLARR